MVMMKLLDMIDETTFFGKVFNREKYSVPISLYKLVSTNVASDDGVERYREIFECGTCSYYPFLVVQYRDRDIYAVWDGVHKLKAIKELASKEPIDSAMSLYNMKVPCAVQRSEYGILFHMVRNGNFQLGPHFTRYMRPAMKKLAEDYLSQISSDLSERVKRFL